MNLKELNQRLEDAIQGAYANGVTADTAEKLAAEFLFAQLKISAELAKKDLDSRMRKTGVKAVKAAIYMESASKGDKRPTEAALSMMVDQHEVVQSEQNQLDRAEVDRAELERLYDVYLNSHIYFRGIAKGNFGG
jgi:hypothetical protein